MESSMRVIVLLLVMRFSASEEVKKNLTGTVGGNITLPDSVQEEELGFLSYGRKNIAMVNKGGFDIYEDIYKNRLQWDRNSGLFTLTELQRNDSGIYTVDSKTGKVFTSSYELRVYDPVPTPNVTKLNSSSESCSLLCWVDRETTLLWFKDEQMLNQSSSALSLPLTVHKQDFSSSYRCVAANPAEEKTLPVRVRTTCGDTDDTDSSTEPRKYYILIIIFVLLVLMIILAACFIKSKYLSRNKTKTNGQAQGPAGTQEEVQYSEIQISNNRQGESSTTIYHTNLTTVYDKLEAHRMITDNRAEST